MRYHLLQENNGGKYISSGESIVIIVVYSTNSWELSERILSVTDDYLPDFNDVDEAFEFDRCQLYALKSGQGEKEEIKAVEALQDVKQGDREVPQVAVTPSPQSKNAYVVKSGSWFVISYNGEMCGDTAGKGIV